MSQHVARAEISAAQEIRAQLIILTPLSLKDQSQHNKKLVGTYPVHVEVEKSINVAVVLRPNYYLIVNPV